MKFFIEDDDLYFNYGKIGKIENHIVSGRNMLFREIGIDFFKESKCLNYCQANIKNNIFFENIVGEDFLEDTYISFLDKESTSTTTYDVWKKNDKILIAIPFLVTIKEWNEYFPLKYFLREFSIFLNNSDSNIYRFSTDEYYFITYLIYEIQDNQLISEVIEIVHDIYYFKYDEFINQNKIENSISFPPEHLTAGSSILQYFGKLLQEKYPDEKISVSIKQKGLKVTMIIETPDGKKEEIEEYLNRYGMVITNQITPQEFATNPIQLIELKQELREAQNKILFQQE